MLACLNAYTAVLRSLHAFDLMRDGCSASACNVSTVISTSSGDVTALMVDGPVAEVSCGGVKGPFALMEIDAWALLRLRFAILAVGGEVVTLQAQARQWWAQTASEPLSVTKMPWTVLDSCSFNVCRLSRCGYLRWWSMSHREI